MENGKHGRSLHAAAIEARDAADFSALASVAREMIATSTKTGDASGLVWGHYFSGVSFMHYNDADAAERELKIARERFEKNGQPFEAARATSTLAAVSVDLRLDLTEGRRLLDSALSVIGESGDLHLFAVGLGNLAELLRLEGDYRQALKRCSDAAEIFIELGDNARAGWQLANASLCHALLRDYAATFETIERAYEQLQ